MALRPKLTASGEPELRNDEKVACYVDHAGFKLEHYPYIDPSPFVVPDKPAPTINQKATGTVILTNQRMVFVSNAGWLSSFPKGWFSFEMPLDNIHNERFNSAFVLGNSHFTGLSKPMDLTMATAQPYEWTVSFSSSSALTYFQRLFLEQRYPRSFTATPPRSPESVTASNDALTEAQPAAAAKTAEPAKGPAWLRTALKGLSGVDESFARADAWCVETGIDSLYELKESGMADELVAEMTLKPGKAAIVSKRLAAA